LLNPQAVRPSIVGFSWLFFQ